MTPRHGPRLISCFLFSFLFFSFLFSSLLIPFDSGHAAGVLPDTGQTRCYNNTGEIPCPAPGDAFYGQDGNYQGPQPAYQVSADDLVVSDLNTGLMWQRADDGVTRTWAAAVSYCEGLALGGYSDWRLPYIQELESIVDYGDQVRIGMAINPAFGCSVQGGWYWSGSTNVTYPDHAWCVNFDLGRAENADKTSPLGLYMRCVRGGP